MKLLTNALLGLATVASVQHANAYDPFAGDWVTSSTKFTCDVDLNGEKSIYQLELQKLTAAYENHVIQHAKFTNADGSAINEGTFTSYIIEDKTRLAGMLKISVQTKGDLGEINLHLVGDDSHVFGNGEVNDGTGVNTILLGCKPAAQ